MRVALRIAEERATLTKKMADEARRGGLWRSADSYERTSRQSRRHVETLREALQEQTDRRIASQSQRAQDSSACIRGLGRTRNGPKLSSALEHSF